MTERHLIVLWSGCANRQAVLDDIAANVHVVSVREQRWVWPLNMLCRFYLQPRPVVEAKARHCGLGPFTVVEVDVEPTYEPRSTTSGVRPVNVHMFDGKQRWRRLAGNPETVHATDDPEEARRNMAIIGAETFTTVGHALTVLDAHTPYVVLRNWEPLPDGWKVDGHGDVDLLVEDLDAAVRALGAWKVFPEPYRVHYHVKVGAEMVPFDLRFVGDGYYDERWERGMLERRVQERGFWHLNREDHYWSLLYHALVHKGVMRDDYHKTLRRLSPGGWHSAPSLKAWLVARHGYEFTTPLDLTVPPHAL